ncbi:hypothetical protein AVEN_266875-1 [Araneus ventricosus]|uniref:Uncharacterized protein n=1 Tax=Araneus ventricosus TaxID=182803 RepID=A0A4Y2SVR7_ARAVE|nr:hypothetical protein AVEN_266875-1 [Araneus ventricosus]
MDNVLQLYVPSDVAKEPFLRNAVNVGFVQLVSYPEAKLALNVRVDPLACACDADHLVVHDDTVVVFKDSHVVKGYPAYALPAHATNRDVVTLVTWLTRHQFHTFVSKIENGTLNRYLGYKLFSSSPHPHCTNCTRFTLLGETIFLIKHTVLSAQNKGPTIESVTEDG